MVYCITFYMQTPIITTTQIHLDAVLSAVHPAMHGKEIITKQSVRESITIAPLPIDSAKIERDWVWCCTAADYSSDAKPYYEKITKRKDGMDYWYINSRQTPRTGAGRDRCDAIYGVLCSAVNFWASTTNEKELSRICNRVKNIGGMRKMGYGAVTGFEIAKTELNWKECLVQKSVVMRNLPCAMVQEECQNRVYTHHPYWIPCNLNYGVEAGGRATLKSEVWLNAY